MTDTTIDYALENALAHASADWKVFPCKANSKLPATLHGFKDATSDAKQIRRWAVEFPGCNWAACPADQGMIVVDVDVKKGGTREGLPETYTVQTPNAGFHCYYLGTGPSTVEKLGKGVDTRSIGGYVLLAGSSIDGRDYEVVDDKDPLPFPQVLADRLAPTRAAREAPTDVEPDLSANISRSMSAIKADLGANGLPREGEGSDARAYAMAATCRDLALSPDKAAELLHRLWAPHFDRDWIELKVANAFAYAQNDLGVDAIQGSAADSFGGTEAFKQTLAESPEQPLAASTSSSRFRLVGRNEYRDLPSPSWLIANVLPERGVALLVGHSQSLKSFIALDLAVSVATGSAAFNSLRVRTQGAVVYVAGEGAHGIKAQRVPALEKSRGINFDQAPLFVVDNMPLVQDADQVDELAAEIAKGVGSVPVRLIVVDTLACALGTLDENAAAGMNMATAAANSLAKRFACLVLLVHHLPKAASGEDANPRGSGALFAAADTVLLATRASASGIATRLSVAKAKDSDPGAPVFLEGETVEVGRNAEGQAVTSLVLKLTTREAVEEAGDDTLGDVTEALRRLGAVSERDAVGSWKLASEMLRVGEAPLPADGTRLTAAQERLVKATDRKLRRCTSLPQFAHLHRKAGSSKTSPTRWSLPPEERVEITP